MPAQHLITVISHSKGNKTMVAINKLYYTDKSRIEIQKKEVFHRFMSAYLERLKKSLIKKTIIGRGEFTYYSCGQDHDRRNPAWKPFDNLEKLCKKHGYDPLFVRCLLEENLGRTLACECEVLTDPNDLKKRRLMSAGVDLESGRKEMEIL